MHYDFCTLFDRNYLFRGLALHESLQRHVGDFTLWVLCMDDIVYEVLQKMHLPQLELISLAQFEDENLLRAKATRTEVEYCWTCTPSLPLYLLDHVPGIEMITYLDADLFFFGDLAGAYAEMGGGSIGIVEHRYSPAYEYNAEISGIYNVAFMVFKNDKQARECLEWWRDRCNEWCYFRFEDGKMGDQKYLDDWPERFNGVVVLQHAGVGLAPWNLRSHRIASRGGRLMVEQQPVVFYHFHSFLILGDGAQFRLADPIYKLGAHSVRLVYRPYAASIVRAIAQVSRIAPGYAYGISEERLEAWTRRAFERTRLRMNHYLSLFRSRLRHAVWRLFWWAGYNVTSVAKQQREAALLTSKRWRWLETLHIGTLVDVGANTGQFARHFRDVQPDGFVYSFEPLRDCFEELQRSMAGRSGFAAFNVALGDSDGETAFFRSRFSPSSSLLPMGKLHKELFPATRKITTEKVPLRRLDSYLDEITVTGGLLIKIDVQGAEIQVLKGGRQFLSMADAVVAEVAYLPLYEGQATLVEIAGLLDDAGLAFIELVDQYLRPSDSLPVYGDALFVRRASLERWENPLAFTAVSPASDSAKVQVNHVASEGVDPSDGKAKRGDADLC